jgi:hypothetical protein
MDNIISMQMYNGRGSIKVLSELGIIRGLDSTYLDASVMKFVYGSFVSISGVYYYHRAFGTDGVFVAACKDGQITFTPRDIIINMETGEVRDYYGFKPIGDHKFISADYITKPTLILKPTVIEHVANKYTIMMFGGEDYYLADEINHDDLFGVRNKQYKYIIGQHILWLYSSKRTANLTRLVLDIEAAACDLPGHVKTRCKALYPFPIEHNSPKKYYIVMCGDNIIIKSYSDSGKFTKAAMHECADS